MDADIQNTLIPPVMRGHSTWLWWALGAGGLVWVLYSQSEEVEGAVDAAVETGVDTVQAIVSGWQTVQQGPVWVPVLNAAENRYGIPQNLLARMAYQESHFRQGVIDGSIASPAGALGILQLMPQFFSSVRVPRPYSPQDTAAQIEESARELSRLYGHYQDWGLAVAAYNWGQGNVDRHQSYGGAVPAETATYVAAVFTDVPVNGATQVG